jgi:PST family polysaccharide transporter
MSPAHPRVTQADINESILSVDHLKDGIGARTTRGGAIVMASQLIKMFVQLGATFVLARLLSPDDFGVVAIGYTVLAFLVLFTEIGLTTITIQAKKLTQNTASTLFYLNILITLMAVGVAALLSPLLVAIFHDERVPAIAIALTATSPISALGAQHNALLMRNMKWTAVQALNVGGLAAGSVVAVVGAWFFGIGYWALVVQALVTCVVVVAGAWILCPWRPSIVRSWEGVGKVLKMSVNISGTMALHVLHRQIDNLLIGSRWGTVELGYYTRAYTLLMLPLNLVTGPLSTALIPALSRLQDDLVKWRRAYLDALTAVTIISGGIAAIMFGAADTLILIVLGSGWDRSAEIFSALVIAMFAATPLSTVNWVYISLGRTAPMVIWGLISTAVFVAAFIIGLPNGAPGVALAYGVAQLVVFIPGLWMATRNTNMTLGDTLMACGPILLATLAVGVALRYATANMGVMMDVVAAMAAGIVYCGLVALIMWRWPAHKRLRERSLETVQDALMRFRASRRKATGAG